MKPQNIIKAISNHLKHLALAVAFAAGLGAGSARAAIGWVATSPSATVTASTSLAINKPAGVVAGNVMLAEIAQYYSATATDATAAGWTLIKGGAFATVNRYGTLLYRVADASDDSVSSYTFTLNPGAVDLAIGSIMAFSGVDPVTPLDVVGAGFTSANSATVTGAGITTLSPNTAVVMFAMYAYTSGTVLPAWSAWTTTAPGALTEIADYQAVITTPARGVSIGAAWATKATAGATGNGTATSTPASRNAGVMIALLPYAPSDANIFTFGLPGNPAVINGTNITLHMPWGTTPSALTHLAPTYTTTRGATCPMSSGSPQDFNSPVHYIVTSSDNSTTQDYTVSVVVSTEMIANVQFYDWHDSAPSMTNVQGPVASTATTPIWNQFTGTPAADAWGNNLSIFATPQALVSTIGTPSGISLSITGNGTRRPGSWGSGQYGVIPGFIPIFGGGAYVDNRGNQISTFSGLTVGAKYDVYVMNTAGAEADMRVTSNSGQAIRLRGANPDNGAFDGTTDWTSFITTTQDVELASVNTAYFKDLTPTAEGTLSFTVNNANFHRSTGNDWNPIGVAGFQLVQVALPPAAAPLMTTAGSPLTAVSTTYGTASPETSFTVSGVNMNEGILVTSPAGFEVSQSSGNGFAATTTVGAAGTIDNTTIYVRLTATAAVVGTYNSRNIVLSSKDAPTVNVTTAASGNTVTPKSLTVTATGPATKPYGTTLVAGPSTTDFTAGATGVGSEVVTSVTLTPDGDGASPATAVGDAYVITPSAATGTGGFLASNYNITYTPYEGTVVIGTPTLSVSNPLVIYDGSPHAAVVSASVPGIGSVDGIVSDVRYNGSGTLPAALGTYAVTADFVPTETGNFSSLNDAPAGNFAIVKKEIMMVNVQFYDTANSFPSMTNLQGAAASYDNTPTWNQFPAGGWNFVIPTGGPEALVQADGTASGITLSMTGARRGGSWGGQGTNGIAIFGGGAYWDNGSDQTSVFSGLTVGVNYDLYVMNAAGSMSDSRFTVNGNTAGAIRLRGAVAGSWPGTWSFDSTTDWSQWVTTSSDATGDDPLVGSTANTAYFQELTPDADGKLTIVMSHANNHRSDDFSAIAVAGYQLVQLPPQARMLSFGPGATISGTAIAWTMPYNTTPEEIKILAPTFTLSADAKCYDMDPADPLAVEILSGAVRNFTDPVHYFVKSSDGLITTDYTVTVTVTPPPPTPILVGTTPMPLTFDTQPSKYQWTTLSVSGASADLTTDGDLDTAMSGIAAGSINTELTSQADSGMLGTAYWRSGDQKLGTQPTGNAMTLLMATLQNNSGGTIDSLTVSYIMGLASITPTDDIKGHRVYWSKTGTAGTWTAVGDFLLTAPGTLNVSFDLPSLAWANADLLYVVWADDNGLTNPDGDYTIDNLSFVKSTAGGYGTWAGANAPGQSPGEDFDHDGVENGIEYFMGQTGSSLTVLPGLDADNTVTWPMSTAFTGDYEVQTSPNLNTWTNVSPKPTPAGGNLTYTLAKGAGQLFVRLLVTPN